MAYYSQVPYTLSRYGRRSYISLFHAGCILGEILSGKAYNCPNRRKTEDGYLISFCKLTARDGGKVDFQEYIIPHEFISRKEDIYLTTTNYIKVLKHFISSHEHLIDDKFKLHRFRKYIPDRNTKYELDFVELYSMYNKLKIVLELSN